MAQEAEARRQEAVRQRLREVRAAEEAYAAINLPLINADWLHRMRKFKLHELRREASDLAAQVSVRQQRWESALREQLAALGQASASLEAAWRRQLGVLGSLLGLQEQRMASSLQQHQAALLRLQMQFADERTFILQAHQARKQVLLDSMAEMQKTHAAAEAEASASHAGRLREVLDTWSERNGVIKLLTEERLEALKAGIAQEDAAFHEATAADAARHMELSSADAAASQQIEEQAQQLRQLQSTIASLRHRLQIDAERWRQHVAEAKAAKGQALHSHAALQRELAATRNRHEAELQAMAAAL